MIGRTMIATEAVRYADFEQAMLSGDREVFGPIVSRDQSLPYALADSAAGGLSQPTFSSVLNANDFGRDARSESRHSVRANLVWMVPMLIWRRVARRGRLQKMVSTKPQL